MNENRVEILGQLERGELTVDAASRLLTGNPETHSGELAPNAPSISTTSDLITRRQRLAALAAQTGAWAPERMVTPPGDPPRSWPWPEHPWQWFWQDFSHPLHLDHTFEPAPGTHLYAAVYNGDLNLNGWAGPQLTLGAAAFDLRVGHQERALRLAAATGMLDLGVPGNVTKAEVRALSGDVRIRDLCLQRLQVRCESGDLRGEQIRADLNAELFGGDADLFHCTGEIRVTAHQGHIRLRDPEAGKVELIADEGVELRLGRVESGHFRCETRGGDLEVCIGAGSACQLSLEAREGGLICPVRLPWSALEERSPHRLRGQLKGGGATIELVAHGGRIYLSGE
ncbi:MAG: hypothetical protein IT369_07015 [Candidatus Latescibacteria bacterium]|nr:hypothetical protein [Candidatus Latescibacterota bacterium]